MLDLKGCPGVHQEYKEEKNSRRQRTRAEAQGHEESLVCTGNHRNLPIGHDVRAMVKWPGVRS